jgi:PTH1 family peptidyl-tRNA hydrolase
LKLIIGLGNPGSQYVHTRHNIGFRIIDEIAKRYDVKLKKKLFGKSKQAQIRLRGKGIILVQPLTFMNLSGRCVKNSIDTFKASVDEVLIICDDVNIMLGKIRLRKKGSAGGHNGLSSIIETLGSDTFSRLRAGIGSEKPIRDLSDYVLSDFDQTERELVETVIARAADACEYWWSNGIDRAMNLYNE